MSTWSGKRALVVGASRGFGRGIAEALAEAGAEVHALSRSGATNATGSTGSRIHTIAADATQPELPRRVLAELEPAVVVLNAGATPRVASIQEQSWESFSVNWNTDVKLTFHWLQAILLRPLAAGSSVIALSSGAALKGSPLSGGYAGAKATVRFMMEYAALESARASLGIRFVSLLPAITTDGGVGRPFAEAYAKRQSRTVEELVGGTPLTAAMVGAAVVRVVTDCALDAHGAFRLTASGLAALP